MDDLPSVETTTSGPCLVAKVRGVMDYIPRHELSGRLAQVIDGAERAVVLNLADVSFCGYALEAPIMPVCTCPNQWNHTGTEHPHPHLTKRDAERGHQAADRASTVVSPAPPPCARQRHSRSGERAGD
ncbi:STAS domain-containing protein [Streptomyces durhamensis]|uniref:STAS domain-containing protein n=1 Tax=Streptomyces durhamensis TaxID=68194 RepID=UPI000AB9BE73|nr:hypothetical protein [Streptomyces durhamensis]